MIVGLAGAKESGKNTFAKLAWEIFGATYDVKEFSFAKKLKKSAVASLGMSGHEFDSIDYADALKDRGLINIEVPNYGDHGLFIKSLTGREFLQFYGTEAHRDIFNNEFWVDVLLTEINE